MPFQSTSIACKQQILLSDKLPAAKVFITHSQYPTLIKGPITQFPCKFHNLVFFHLN